MAFVVGPPHAGVSSVAAVLRERLPDCTVTEDACGADVVVLVASAVAPLTPSDCAALEAATQGGVSVVAAVTRIDAHRAWHEVLAADARALGAWQPRLADVPWVGVAAAPDVGEPDVGELVEAVRRALLAGGATARPTRAGVVANRRVDRAKRVADVRHGLQRERVRLAGEVRRRCADLHAEFRAAAAELPRGASAAFEVEVQKRADAVAGELEVRIVDGLGEIATSAGVRPPAAPGTAALELPVVPPAAARRGEARLTAALGAGFGLGVAMAAGRLLAGVLPAAVGYGIGVLLGCALTSWLVMARKLLGDRAAAERWAYEAVSAMRWQLDAAVADAFVTAEAWFAGELTGTSSGGVPTLRF